MPKQLNVNLSFTADTQQARAQLQDLQSQLTKITANAGNSPLGLTQEISAAVVETTKLQTALQKATTSTGSLDLGAFRQELQKANLSVEKVATTLTSLGPEGQAAFAQLAQSVSLAEVPIRRTNGLLSEFVTTLKNTARWQISSSILHGFMGSLQSAYRYAQDLNESLTNIRIVTGQSTEQMADFAKQANKAAKELSTTTTAYTDAALIFYQQGLTGDDVTERTDTVIKMANVTGDSAEEVSSYMTAIWNNFYDGSKSLEHYADVITALGAATASSSAEIAAGLEKFASVGETIGLTYDYATSALATVVASTRQSAETVGNGFRTIFTRLQGLKLGETLDDGTDLNKYSQALASVGVNIKTVDGELKDMDTILDELGERWGELSKDQQVALAQTVAGVRQYVNLVALMDNWDFMQKNVEIAKNANGSLQEQADIYAESWEAAQKRVKASMQAIYGQVLDDKFFIELTNGMSTLVDTISHVIDALGGLKGVLPLVGTLMIRAFGSDISNAINNTIYNIQLMSKTGREEIYKMRSAFVNNLKEMADDSTALGGAQRDVYTAQAQVQENLLQKTIQLESQHRSLTDEEQKQLQLLLDINNNIGQQYLDLAKVREQEEAITNQLVAQARAKVQAANRKQTDTSNQYNSFDDDIEAAQILQKQFIIGTNLVKDLNKELANVKNGATSLESLTTAAKNLQDSFKHTGVDVKEFENELSKVIEASSVDELEVAIDELDKKIQMLGADAQDSFDNIATEMEVAGVKAKDAAATVDGLQQKASSLGATEGQLATTQNNLNKNVEKTNEEIGKLAGRIPTAADQFMALGQTIMSVSMVISSLSGVIDTLSDPDLTGWEKFVAVLSAAGMMIPSLIMTTRSLTTAFGMQAVATEGATAAQWGLNVAMDANPVGVIILGITALVGVIAGAITIYDKFTMSVEEANEKLEEFNEKQKEFSGEQTSLQSNIDELQQMQDEYDKLSAKAGQYDRDIDRLTESERERYNEIKNKIVECNDTSVAYYNEQGEAILRNNDGLRESIALLQEEIDLKRNALYNDDFKDTNKAHNTKYQGAQTDLSDAEDYYASLTDPDGDWAGMGMNYEDYMISNMQSYNWSNIQTTLNDTSSQTQDTMDAMQELYDIIGQGTEAILKAKEDGSFDRYSEILSNALKESGFDSQIDNVQNYLDGIVNQAEEYADMVEKAAGDVEKAKVNAEAASKLDLNWVLGVVKYNEDRNDDYELLKNAGIENVDAYLTAYANGITLGVSKDLNGNLIASYDDVYDAISLYEQKLYDVLRSNPDLDDNLEKAGKSFSERTFTFYQDYCHQLAEEINEFIEKNPDFKKLPETVRESLLNSIFGTGNLDFDTDGFVTGLDTKYSEAITKFRQQLLDKVNEGAITAGEMVAIDRSDITNFIPYDQLDNLDYIIDNIDEATLRTDGWKAAIQEVLDSLEATEKFDFAPAMNDSVSSIITGVQSGKLNSSNIADDENYQVMISNLEELKNQYPELIAAADLLNQTWLVGTQEYAEALEMVQDKMSEVNLDSLREQARNASDDFAELFSLDKDGVIIDINADSEEFGSKMDALLNAEYAVDVAIHTEAEQEFDSISAAMADIKAKASLIGDDFVVAADKVRELNNTFPGILEGMEIVGDGTVKLNQQIVQSAMGMAEAEVKADAQATIDKLHNQASLLRAKQTSYQNMANAALILAKNESDTDEQSAAARATISAELANLQELNSQEAAQSSENNAKETADASQENGAVIAQNWQSAFQTMADASYQAATIAIRNMKAVESGGEAVQGTVSVQYNGTSGVDKEASIIQNTQDALNSPNADTDWGAMAEAYAQMADQAGAAANDIEGMIAQIGATGTDGKKDKEKQSKEKEQKHKDLVDKFEADPFHKVNQELEDVAHNLKMVNKQQSHMFGKELINNLKQQNVYLKEQVSLHKQKAQIARDEAAALQSQLQAEGVAFDGDNIANYNAMLQSAENQINNLITQYNNLSAAEQEAYDKMADNPIKQAEKYYDNLKKMMDKYTDYMSIAYSEEEAALDGLYQQIENNLKAYEVEIELKLDMSEARRAMNKFLKDMSTDIKNMYKTSAEWATTFQTSEKDAGTYKNDVNTKLKQLEDYKNASVGGADDMFATESEKYKAITDLEKEILEDSENLLNEYQTAYDNLRDAFGEVADQFNEILDQFDSINDTLDHYAKVIELLYGGETDNGREQLTEVYSLQKENSLARQDAMRKWGDELQKRRADAITKGYDEDDSYIKDIDAQIEENSKNLESEIENYIDTIQKELENSIKMAQSQMDKSIWGASMADARQEWDDKKAMADGYYDSVERIYQLESLESKWKAAITNTSSLKAQQQLAAIMDKQVTSLESKNALSEKDIELAEKELAVYQAQIALEEAQNNKNSMKLTRDETGNWSYQYVADEGDIADKQQSYLDKINEWRTASINAAEEIAERTMDAYEAFSERMTEIMNDVTLSEEERDAKIAELNETYWGEDGIITKLVEDSNYIQSVANRATYVELAGLYEADEANLERMTEAEKTLIENMNAAGVLSYESLRDYIIGDDGKSGIYGEIYDLCKQTNEDSSAAWKSMAADAINRMYKDPDSVSKTVKQAYVDMEGALKIYNKAIEDSEKASGIEWSKVGLQLDGVQKKIGDTANKVDDITGKLGDLSAFEDAVLRIKEMWDETAGSIRQATSDLEDFLSLLANADGGGGGGDIGSGGSGDTGGDNTGGGGTGGGSGGDGNLTVGETVTYTGGTYYHDSYGATPSGSRGPGKKVKVTQIKEDGSPYPIHVMSSDSAYGWLTKGQLSGYDTGGYTGDWAGGEGRLALLHHKELVLNAQDTQNILAAVDSIRQIASLGSSISGAIASSIGNMIMSLTGLGNNNYGNLRSNATNEGDNIFNITAEFPNADSVETIQEAIMSLPTLASQYLSRDRK